MITEERFQKMTWPQWLFHYTEVLKNKREEDNKFDVLLSYMELVGTMANPEAGKKLQEIKDQKKYQTELNADNFAQEYEKLKAMIPGQIDIKVEGADDKFILPKFEKKERKLGINKGGEE